MLLLFFLLRILILFSSRENLSAFLIDGNEIKIAVQQSRTKAMKRATKYFTPHVCLF